MITVRIDVLPWARIGGTPEPKRTDKEIEEWTPNETNALKDDIA